MADENNNENNQGGAPVAIDYDKLASIIDGKQKATEDSVLKGYFKQQGLSADEMTQAIADFKTAKAAKEPNVDALNAQIADANKRAVEAEIKVEAMSIAGELGVSASKMPYVMKLADMSSVVVDGKVDAAKLKEALSAVLKDVPELKAQDNNSGSGFKIGADSSGGGDDKEKTNAELARIFGVKLNN